MLKHYKGKWYDENGTQRYITSQRISAVEFDNGCIYNSCYLISIIPDDFEEECTKVWLENKGVKV